TSASTATLGSTCIFTATVSGPVLGATPTGNASWSLTGVTGSRCDSTSGPTGSTNTVTYICSVTATSAGVYVPLFTYNGDSNYLASALTSGYTTTVGKATPTVVVAANSSTSSLGSTISFTATVTGPTGAIAPSGAGTWVITGITGVSTCTVITGPTSTSYASTYICNVVASAAGSYGATFTFSGDSAY